MYGRTSIATPSRFLADIPPELLKTSRERGDRSALGQSSFLTGRSSWGSGKTAARSPNGRSAASWGSGARKNTTPLKAAAGAKFTAGMKVRHSVFGDGIVVSSMPKDDDEEVTIAFVGKGVKKLIAGFANLQPVKE
jgi:DNA helicase-2/ATP-dependent DNA helicase PcrA